MRPPAPAARDTPTSRTGTPPAADALPEGARPGRSPTRGKAAPPAGAPDAPPGTLPDVPPGTGPDAGADAGPDAKPNAPPPAPRKEAVRRAGASPPQRLPPVGVLPMDIPPASTRPQGPHPAGFRPAKRFRRKRRPRPEPRARQTGKPPAPPQPPHPGSRCPRACPFPPSAAVPAPVPDWAYPPERLPRRVWARLREEPRQGFRDGWRKRRARPRPTRRGTPRRTRCGTPPQASGRPPPCVPAWPPSAGIPASP